ncbi:MAG: hypothetical protein ABI568_10000, partial [Pseudarthrobacter sp.]
NYQLHKHNNRINSTGDFTRYLPTATNSGRSPAVEPAELAQFWLATSSSTNCLGHVGMDNWAGSARITSGNSSHYL